MDAKYDHAAGSLGKAYRTTESAVSSGKCRLQPFRSRCSQAKAGGNLVEANLGPDRRSLQARQPCYRPCEYIFLFAATGHAAALIVLCDSPVEPALTKVADVFRQETNEQVTLRCNPGPAIKKRIEGGEVADVVVVEPDFVEALTNSGKVRAGERPMVGQVGVGLGNKIGSPASDISTAEKLKTTLLGAD